MAEDRVAVLETVRKAAADGDVDFLHEGVRVLAQALMEAEVTELTGMPKGERDPARRLTSPERVPRSALGHTGGDYAPELASGNDEGSAWRGFVRGLVERGLSGVRLVIGHGPRGGEPDAADGG
jgi:transposase-like protein